MKCVLFVDDEPHLIDGLRVSMRRMREKWEMEFAGSGREAIDLLERRSFDVIVTDQRMPEMDGASLLKVVRERWPQTVRIVLSGYADLAQTVQLVPVAHQYISKPCQSSELENVIDRCIALRDLIQRPTLRALVGKLGVIPPAPATYAALQLAIASDSTTVSDIAGLVMRDTVVTGKLLQMVNSGFFRLPRRVASVTQAVNYLGLNIVRNLVVSAEVFCKWPVGSAPSSPDLEILQTHASHVAATMMKIAPGCSIDGDALLAGLLHDIGYWVLSHGHAKELAEAQELARAESIPMDHAEERVLGASHAEIGAYLLGIWGFPSSIVEAVAHHHAPCAVKPAGFDTLAALCIAHALTEPGELVAFPGLSVPHSEISPEYLIAVQAPFTWEEASASAWSLRAGESTS